MNIYKIIILLLLVSCTVRSGRTDGRVVEPELLLTDSVSSGAADYLAVLMSRELTEKTTFIVDDQVLDGVLQSKGRSSDFQMHLLNGIIHSKLISDKSPVGYRTIVPLFV